MTKRVSINNLMPDTNYGFRVRAKDLDGPGDWSPIFKFKTIKENGTPKTPANVTWVVDGDTFDAEWDAVTENTQNKPTVIATYEIEMVSNAKYVTKTVAGGSEERYHWELTFPEKRTLFGAPLDSAIAMRVRAVDNAGRKSAWSIYYTTQIGAPEPPTNFVAKGEVDKIILTWDRSVTPGIKRYDLHVETMSSYPTLLVNRIFSGDSDTFTYHTTNYSQHYFTIYAVNEAGIKSIPVYASGEPKNPFGLDEDPPKDLENFDVTITHDAADVATATATWDFDEEDEENLRTSGFVVRYRKVGDTAWSIQPSPPGANTVAFTLPRAHTPYEFQGAAWDAYANYSTWVPEPPLVRGDDFPGPPGQVTGLTAAPTLEGVQLTWTAGSEGDIRYYTVDLSEDSGFTSILASYDVGATTISINGLSFGTQYYARVRAVDQTELEGANSDVVSFSTGEFPTPDGSDGYPPAAVSSPTLTGGFGYLSANWSPVTTNSNGDPQSDTVTYEIYLAKTSGFTPGPGNKVGEINGTFAIIRKEPGGADLSYTDTYYVKVIARDLDGVAPSSAASNSSSPLKSGTFDIDSISVAQLTTGSITNEVFTLATGGIIKSEDYDGPGGNLGFALTNNGFVLNNGAIDAKAIRAGSTFTQNLSVGALLTIATSGFIRSANYSDGTSTPAAGFSLSSVGLDIRSGTVAVGTLTSGTISSKTIVIGVGGSLIVDSNGEIRSNNYSAGTTGWRISNSGAEFNGLNATISASNLLSGTVSTQTITIASGGVIKSNQFFTPGTGGYPNGYGWQIDEINGIRMYSGSIQGAEVLTNQLGSLTIEGGRRTFSINSSGYAEVVGLRVYGNTTLGSSSTDVIQSYNYSPSNGWRIGGDGRAYFRGGEFDTRNGSNTGVYMYNTSGGQGTIQFFSSSSPNPNGFSGNITSVGPGMFIGYTGDSIENAIQIYNNRISLPTASTSSRNQIRNAVATDFLVNGPINITGSVQALAIYNNNLTGSGRAVRIGSGGVMGVDVPSSLRYKNNIENPNISVEKILKMNVKTYYYNDDIKKEDKRYGFIAEQVDKLNLPWVGYKEFDGKVVPNSFDYENFMPNLLLVDQHQEKKIKSLESKMDELEELVKRLLTD